MLKVKNKDTTIPSLDVNGYILPCVLVILSFFEKKKKKKKKKNIKSKKFCHILFKLLSYSLKNALKNTRDLQFFSQNWKVTNKIKSK